jgi:ribose-phosphate pyrophosphokinase
MKDIVDKQDHKIKLIAGRSNPELADLISKQLKIPLTPVKIVDFSNSEISIEISENVRGDHVFIIQTGGQYQGRTINDHLQELYAMIHAVKLASAKTINLIMPCYSYARGDKKDKPRVPIMGSVQALIFTSLGVTHVVSMDLHAGQIQGFFQQIPMDNLYGIKLHCDNLKSTVFKGLSEDEVHEKFVLASPDVGGAKRTEAYAQRLGMKHVILHKHRNYEIPGTVDKSILVGENDCVKNKTVIIIDDMCDTLGSMISAANELEKNGAVDVIIVATHGVLSGPALDRLNDSKIISKAIVMNTLPQEENLKKTNKLQVVDVSELMANVIKKIRFGGEGTSISELFK